MRPPLLWSRKPMRLRVPGIHLSATLSTGGRTSKQSHFVTVLCFNGGENHPIHMYVNGKGKLDDVQYTVRILPRKSAHFRCEYNTSLRDQNALARALN
jgi:hypothetical protein